jgi:hypothetical protein|tara:strand:- start:692 stop:814 length:123 start_codon:yes stop_codon:yes gene_type:complete
MVKEVIMYGSKPVKKAKKTTMPLPKRGARVLKNKAKRVKK